MPSIYFFHLKLELYPTPAVSFAKPNRRTSPLVGNRYNNDNAQAVFVPQTGFDIFRDPLPAHRTGKWANSLFAKKQPGSLPSTTQPQSSSPSRPFHPSSEHTESHGDTLLLPERSSSLRKDAPASPRLQAATKPSNQATSKDWRYEAVEIESIDMDSKAKGTASGGLHTKAVYLPSDPKTTEVGYGVVHLYRDTDESVVLEDNAASRKNLDRFPRAPEDTKEAFDPDECTTLCILAVPSWMMPSDLLGFVGAEAAWEDVSHFRLIRTGRANKYLVLMKFRSAKKARDWQKAYNGRLFSAAEPENCHVVFIKSVEFVSPDSDISTANFPQNTNDPFTAVNKSAAGKTLSSKPLAPPPPNLLELPTCPVCLERMDETTGLLTILCQHVFHCACLEKWRGSGCPVCRYTHSPSYTFPYPRPGAYNGGNDTDTEPLCSVCASTNNLWICLICGNLGCGRYDSAHAFAHYEATSHCYAMDISSQRVWDYAGDGYVHRLIQSKPSATTSEAAAGSGGRVIDLPSRHENEAFRAEGEDSVPREKMESMATEYTYLLTSQLEGQRRYFEEQVKRAMEKASVAATRADEAAADLAALQASFSNLSTSSAENQGASQRLQTRLDKSDAARQRIEKLARDLSTQLKEEKMLSEGLHARVKALEEEKTQLREERDELEDVKHDLMQFIGAQEKVQQLQAQGEEVVEMHVAGGSGKKGKGKGKKKT